MDAVAARLWVTSGPDEGKSFGLDADIVHIGRGADNAIPLSDPQLAGRMASIASRNGKYFIFVPANDLVEIDGSSVPAERWVGLPASATIRFGDRTVTRFESAALPGAQGGAVSPVADTLTVPRAAAEGRKEDFAAAPSGNGSPVEEGSSEVPGRSRTGKRASGKRKKAVRKSEVARFITDQPGDPLVKLGEDGTLPELTLRDFGETTRTDRAPREKNPLLLYGVLGFSFVASLGMLLLDPTATPVRGSERDAARQALSAYFGSEGDPGKQAELEPFQKSLRQAIVEHSQGDYTEERRLYRQVLQMLNAADIRDPANLNGLTGRLTGRGRASDAELRGHLETLIAP